ncbi:glycosyltransferase family 4 protein [Bythopirellula goksoeyrii]|uniref:Spore coat protein SA n=1 Tax=Bythopirellula goksoeyrii TaxID=1400387 RepID=A0A5B9Q6V5_9BACT|nr:glycosyltransferase family 4 protein [Bythopirellula goksoeyrii]QEG34717.1 Spore coat protein SA [Bythopirellula goksoeyrii]
MRSNPELSAHKKSGRLLTVVQLLPALEGGGVESCTVEINAALVARGHRSVVVSAGGKLVEEIEAVGGESFQLDIGRKSPFALLNAFKLRQFLKQSGVDVLHARSRMPAWIGLLACRMMPARQRPRIVTTVHGLNSVNRYSKVMTYGERIVAVSECCREFILKNYPDTDASKIVVIPHGIDPSKFSYGFQPSAEWRNSWNQQYPSLTGRFVVLLPGRLTRLKGHFDFLGVIDLLKQEGIPVAGLIVGGEDPRRRKYSRLLREEIGRKNLNQDILFTGQRKDLREIMCVSSAVVSTSTKPESFGRTVLESLSLGRPTFGYEHGGVGEILAQVYPMGRVPVGDITAMADKLAQVYQNALQAPIPVEGYDLRSALEKEIELYESLAGDRL